MLQIKNISKQYKTGDLVKYDLEYSSFLGGHSGGNIGDVKRGNPLKLAAAIIKPLENYYIESLSGGSRVNVIPRDFKISFYAKEDDYKQIKDEMNKQIRFYGEDGKITLEKGKEVRSNVYSQDLSKDIIGFIDSYQNGAIEYDENNNVILSANFAAIKEDEDGIRFEYSLRSNDLKLRDEYIERLNKKGKINRVSKGIYVIPDECEFGVIPITEEDIINEFTSNEKGVVVGYRLYNILNLTTQVAFKFNIYSSKISEECKIINTVTIKYADLEFTNEIKTMIEYLEVLENFRTIQDLNYLNFIKYTEKFINAYNDFTLEKILKRLWNLV